MTTTINASGTNGLVTTADGSGIVKLQSNGVTTNAISWITFDGTLTNPITAKASFNQSSVTKNGTGDYTLNFTNALSDANYCPNVTNGSDNTGNSSFRGGNVLGSMTTPTTSAVRVGTWSASSGANRSSTDSILIYVSIFGN